MPKTRSTLLTSLSEARQRATPASHHLRILVCHPRQLWQRHILEVCHLASRLARSTETSHHSPDATPPSPASLFLSLDRDVFCHWTVCARCARKSPMHHGIGGRWLNPKSNPKVSRASPWDNTRTRTQLDQCNHRVAIRAPDRSLTVNIFARRFLLLPLVLSRGKYRQPARSEAQRRLGVHCTAAWAVSGRHVVRRRGSSRCHSGPCALGAATAGQSECPELSRSPKHRPVAEDPVGR